MANYQNRKWEVDKMAPFQDAARTKAALVGGGLQNLSGGVNQGLSGILGAQMMQQGGYSDADLASNPGTSSSGNQTLPLWMQFVNKFKNGMMGMKPENYNRNIYG